MGLFDKLFSKKKEKEELVASEVFNNTGTTNREREVTHLLNRGYE